MMRRYLWCPTASLEAATTWMATEAEPAGGGGRAVRASFQWGRLSAAGRLGLIRRATLILRVHCRRDGANGRGLGAVCVGL